MSRPLTVFHPLPDGDVALFGELLGGDPGLWLPGEPRSAGPGTWEITLSGPGTTRRVHCHVGAPWRTGSTLWRAITWDPEADRADPVPVERLLPRLEGELGLVASEPACFVLDGSYSVPGGPVGEFIDAIALHRVARRTAACFLAQLAGSSVVSQTLGPGAGG